MAIPQPIENEFLGKLMSAIEENMADEQFGVSELARLLGMSRSNLLRKVKSETKLSVTQLIRQQRLQHAMKLLKESALNVSEVSYRTGFSSPSYFIKCFREYYGYSPGEVGRRVPGAGEEPVGRSTRISKPYALGIAAAVLLLGAVSAFVFLRSSSPEPAAMLEKSIAVLPFKNDSNDSTNVYLINGLMESTLNNLQKIKDLRVLSRTSSEKYRNTNKTIPEMASELNVSYFVEGSGQKIGDKIVLNIQLIDARSDRHLWSKQYRREAVDIFSLQEEVAKNIATEIQAIITPEEQERIGRAPTDDLVAYDYFLKGQDHLLTGGRDNLFKSIPLFRKAVAQDPNFALAYAAMAISYYYLDLFQNEKMYTDSIDRFADQALLLDPKLAQSLTAKALSFMHREEYQAAVPYFEKALEYNPNSVFVINMLSDFYANYAPNTAKYLEYALKGVQLDIASHDSTTTSYIYLHLSNALIQSGFVDEAIEYINKSLDYNPDNPFSGYVKSYIMYARHHDLAQTKADLLKEWRKDTTRIDIIQDVAKVNYYMRDYEEAYRFYKVLLDLRETNGSHLYRHENSKIAIVMEKLGRHEQAKELFAGYLEFLETNDSVYKPLGYATYYAYLGDKALALEYLKTFSKQDYIQYWVILFLDQDPIVDGIKDNPEFQAAVKEIHQRFWKNHEVLKAELSEKGLL